MFKQSNWIKQWMAEPRLVRTFFEGDWNSVHPNMLGNLLKYMRVLVAIFNWSIRALWRWMWVRGWGSCGGCRIILNYTASHIMPGNVHLKYKVGEQGAQPGWIVQPRFIHGCGRPEIASVSWSKIYTSKGIVDVSLQKKISNKLWINSSRHDASESNPPALPCPWMPKKLYLAKFPWGTTATASFDELFRRE